ncbi:MAG TPA: c-type cytochrome [Candidatus Acidoferrales bacterium]|nr:c-type cytochrome [Candidatus Acidoferrales bacterium]
MSRTLLIVFSVLSFLLCALVGADGANHPAREGHAELRALALAPEKARVSRNPYKDRPDAIRAGEKLFRQHCAECHGEDGRGLGRAADLRSPGVQNATPGELEWLLRNGNLSKGMPSWSGLPAQRRWQIVTYLKSLR